ncbi:hypothetical protein JOB18_013089 [Solea senegalensis]|uniref:Endonuclease/exonuclease/phosphatase domain-containing protein n=2 Tax=Solea senegalensis TaxID=28829 RepID=A0AAV6RZ85_SOLSE|nr:protein angel homolog 1 [Solea senegalensis]KAG7510094.1 hypothetical protein JOB18_013089 [Solea senegalensis]
MICSLLFYALYPLSRYLTAGRRSEDSQKGLSPAVVHGTAAWDGCAVTTKRFTQSQTTQPDQWLSSSSTAKGKTEEGMKEGSPDKEGDTGMEQNKEQPVAVPHKEPKNGETKMSEEPQSEATKTSEEPQSEATKTSEEPQSEAKETSEEPQSEAKETSEEPQSEAVKTSKEPQNEAMMTSEVPQGKMEVSMQQNINTKEATDVPSEDINPEQALAAHIKWLQTDASIKETDCPGLEEIQIHTPTHSVEELVISAEERIEQTACSGEQQTQIPSMESETPAVSEVTECWDEYYINPAADEEYDGANSSKLVFCEHSQTHLTISKPCNTQNSLHFPAGLGLAGEIECPLWQFPAGSYYPPLESPESFEVMWRVWQSLPAAEPALIPFPFTKTSLNFTVMSYNVLAQDLLEANEELYIHCPLEVLDWSYRCSLLLEEIFKWAPDILCLQEVQENHYHEQLYPVLCQMGYTCVYKRRTGPKTDGCATCYRSSCFSEVSVSLLEFFRPDTELLNRHNVGIVLLLRPVVTQGSEIKAMGPPLCVGNTHLLFNPRRGDVKLAQLAMMLAEIDSTVKSCKAKGEHCNIVLCGDFNSVPNMPLYQLITTGTLYYRGLPAWMVSGQEDLSFKTHFHRLSVPLWHSCLGITDNCQYSASKNTFENKDQTSGKLHYSHDFMRQLRYCPAACVRPVDLKLIQGVTDNAPDPSLENPSYDTCSRHTLTHCLDLESVYQHVLPGSGAPEVTTVHSEVGATVDYIFYSPRRSSTSAQTACGNFVSEGLELIGSLCLLSEDVLWSMNGLPNHMFPSDHLSLVAKFQLDLNSPAIGKTVGEVGGIDVRG